MNYINSDKQLISKISCLLEISEDLLLQKNRNEISVLGRFLFFYFAKKINNKRTIESIGKACNKNHATVLYGIKKIENYLFTKAKIDGIEVSEIVKTLTNSIILRNYQKVLFPNNNKWHLDKRKVSLI